MSGHNSDLLFSFRKCMSLKDIPFRRDTVIWSLRLNSATKIHIIAHGVAGRFCVLYSGIFGGGGRRGGGGAAAAGSDKDNYCRDMCFGRDFLR